MTLLRKDTDESSAASGVLVQTLVPSYGGIKDAASNTEDPSTTNHHHHHQVIIKVIDSDKETGDKIIRRFQLPQISDEETGKPSFEKLMTILGEGPRPNNNNNNGENQHETNNTLYYKDNEGDIVVIATTMELTDAVSQLRNYSSTSSSSLALYTSPPPTQMFVSIMASKVYTSFLQLVKQCFAYLLFTGQKIIELIMFLAQVATEKCRIMTELFLPFGMSQAHHPDSSEEDASEESHLIHSTTTRTDSTGTDREQDAGNDDKLAWKKTDWFTTGKDGLMSDLLTKTPNTNISVVEEFI